MKKTPRIQIRDQYFGRRIEKVKRHRGYKTLSMTTQKLAEERLSQIETAEAISGGVVGTAVSSSAT